MSTVPFWELAGKLKALSSQHEATWDDGINESGLFQVTSWDDEGTLAIIEAPIEYMKFFRGTRDEDRMARDAVHIAMGCRTIVASARSGHLKRLSPGCCDYQFRIRALLPYWVSIEDWGTSHDVNWAWTGAAVLLRQFLAHASLRRDWLDNTASAGSGINRSLAQEDFQALSSYFMDVERCKEWYEGEWYEGKWYEGGPYKPVVTHYLPWLAEDAELAQRVADVWNAIAERGEADRVVK